MPLVDDDSFTLPGNGSTTAPAEPETAGSAAEVTFSDLGLAEKVVRVLAERGVTVPFPIQAATIPDALAGKDVLGRGRTGSGKTLSFGLPLLTRLAEGRTRPKRPRGLILTPTRELAMQVSDALEPYGRVLGLDLKVVCGGTSMPRQIYALERGVDVLVATPGRLRDLVDRGACSLDEVQIAVLDEADQMADMGFLPEVTEILDLVPAGGQRMLFSATLENEIDTLVKRYLNEPVTHEVDPSAGAVTTMTHHILVVKPKDKAPVTNAIAARKGRTIVFVRTQMGADRVAEQLRDTGIRADALHGGMTQGARTRTLGDFKDGYVSVLVATDVAARGIHVDGIDLVLNVDPAADHKDYLHRSGRTARAGRSGTVVTLVLPHQRRGAFRLMEDAGVEATRHIVGGAFDAELVQITGARSLTEVQAESAATAARQAERDVVQLTRELEKLQRRAVELREDADRLAARAARERAELGIAEEPADGAARPEAEPAAAEPGAEPLGLPRQAAAEPGAVAEAAEQDMPQPAADRSDDAVRREDRPVRRREDARERDDRPGTGRSFDRRDDRPRSSDRFDRRDDRRGERRDDRWSDRRDGRPDRGGERPAGRGYDRREDRDRPRSFERRDDRPRSFDRRDERPVGGRSFERRDDRPRSFERRDDRPAGGRSYDRPYGGDRDRGARPAFGDRDRSSRPYGRRDDHRGFGERDRGTAERGDRSGRPFERRTDRGFGGHRGSADRNPGWRRNG